jgi:protein arginine kinase activator
MLCQKCHKNLATVRYAEVIDGDVVNMQLCSTCLEQHQEEPGAGFELSGGAPTPRAALRAQRLARDEDVTEPCPECGIPLNEVIRHGVVGCASCYDRFAASLVPLLGELHTALMHRGKTATVDDERVRIREQLQKKRTLLRSALKTERYEQAAVLRDDIKALEAGLGAALSGAD